MQDPLGGQSDDDSGNQYAQQLMAGMAYLGLTPKSRPRARPSTPL